MIITKSEVLIDVSNSIILLTIKTSDLVILLMLRY